MIQNTHCPYCGIILEKNKSNQANTSNVGKDKEHFIPKIAHRCKSSINPNFYACHKCNSQIKGKIDYIIAWVSKVNSGDSELAIEAFKDAITNSNHNNKRAIETLLSARDEGNGYVSIDIPLSGKEIIEYGEILAKGQYFIENKIIFEPKKQIIKVDFLPAPFWHYFEKVYSNTHDADYYEDLQLNEYSTVTREGEVTAYSSKNKYIFIFYKFLGFTAEIKNNTCKNRKKIGKFHRDLKKKFKY